MKKKLFFGAVFLTLIFLAIILMKLINRPIEKQGRVCFKNHCFSVELAMTSEERAKGLMFRESLDGDKGMLFIFDKAGRYSFWMKNTLIPLDIIWINNDKEVVSINPNIQPCEDGYCSSIKPAGDAKYVLEINGGLSEKIGLRVGDKIQIEYPNSQ